ncbi:MAG TPA: hypothetical protein VF923_05085, partial [Gemmatimonadales bacterium]
MGVSHEMAEMTVDPQADHSNPEVCDPCDINCDFRPYRCYFDALDKYLATSVTFPALIAYDYYICALATPASVGQCPAPSGACSYAPPIIPPLPPHPKTLAGAHLTMLTTWILLFAEALIEHLGSGGDPALLRQEARSRARLAALQITALSDQLADRSVAREIRRLAAGLVAVGGE